MVEPLKSRTMTLNNLQLRTLDLIRKVKFQLCRSPHQGGMSDNEFIEAELEPFANEIYQDRQMLKMHRKAVTERKAE